MVYLLGQSPEFQCEYGYYFTPPTSLGNSSLVCEANSSWSGVIPECSLIICNTSLTDEAYVTLQNESLSVVGKITVANICLKTRLLQKLLSIE